MNENNEQQRFEDEDVPAFVKEAQEKEAEEIKYGGHAGGGTTAAPPKEKTKKKKKEADKDTPVDLTPPEKGDKSTAVVIKNQAMEAFLRSASHIVNVTGLADTSEGKRLMFSIITKAELACETKGITFNQIYQQKFVAATVNAALLGLDAEQDEVYLIPYQEKSGKYTMNVQRGYKGERKMRMLHSINHDKQPIEWIDAFIVREGDTLTTAKTPKGDSFEFKQADPFSTKPIKGVVAYILYENGRMKTVNMSKADIDKRMDASKKKMGGKTSPAWQYWYTEMALGKAISAVCKQIPVEFKDKVLADAYKQTDIEDADYEVVGEEKISLNPASVK